MNKLQYLIDVKLFYKKAYKMPFFLTPRINPAKEV